MIKLRDGLGMKTIGRRGAFVALAALMLSACAGGYGTFDDGGGSIEEQLLGGLVGDLVMLPGSRDDGIDYSQRAPLVTPPDTSALPQPRQVAGANDPNWPTQPTYGSDRAVNTLAENVDDRLSREDLERVRIEGGQTAPDIRDNTIAERPRDRLSPAERRRQDEAFQQARGVSNATDENGIPVRRRYLSEPPLRLRTPAASAAYAPVEVENERDIDPTTIVDEN